MKKLLSLLLLSAILVSCDPIVTYHYLVFNDSDHTLVFRYSHGYANAGHGFTICRPHKFTIIDSIQMRGANPHDEGMDFLLPFDKLNVKTIDSGKVSKNILDRKNWRYSNRVIKFGLMKTGSNIYTLAIDNSDLEKK